ncbi:MAG: hypothetical protein WAP51_01360 [Candidatus Sungiibacteriota bacterium]
MEKKVPRSKEDLIRALGRNLKFLKELLSVYVEKDRDAAILLAVVLRTLLHDGERERRGGSVSLLKQLGKKDIEFVDTAKERPLSNTYDSYRGLTLLKASAGNGFMHFPMLEMASDKKMVKFDEYWNEVIIVDDKKNEFTRKDIVKYIADQDGGAHEDPELDEKYFELSRKGSHGWMDAGGNPVLGLELATTAQIAHEIFETLVPIYKELMKEVGGISSGTG